MANTKHVEMREGENRGDVTQEFMEWCLQEKKVIRGGCHEGDRAAFADGRNYAAIAIPEHNPDLLIFLQEWTAREGRKIR